MLDDLEELKRCISGSNGRLHILLQNLTNINDLSKVVELVDSVVEMISDNSKTVLLSKEIINRFTKSDNEKDVLIGNMKNLIEKQKHVIARLHNRKFTTQ